MNIIRKIDIESWERKSHYEWFSSFADPTFAMDVKMDITSLLEFCKANNLSTFGTVMYVVCECINDNPAFRLRVLNDEVFEIPAAHAAYTKMVGEKHFANFRAQLGKGISTFLSDVKSNHEKYANSNYVPREFNTVSIVDDIYCSCIPWLNFLSIRQPIPDHSAENKSIPRALWGQYYEENSKWYMTLNITASHALVDGLDMANVFNNIQDSFYNIESFIKAREI